MLLLFSKKFGKVSAAVAGDRGKNSSSLAFRPFTHGRYSLYKGRGMYNINSAEVIKAYYGIGEDFEKYTCASIVLEFTEKLLPENIQQTELFKLILDFFDLIETRKKKHMTLVIGYQLKTFQISGHKPETELCVVCGKNEDLNFFSVKDGGVMCSKCRNNISAGINDELLYNISFDIIKVLRYFFDSSLKSIENMALDEEILTKLHALIKDYRACHFGINELKSEEFLKT